MDVRAHSQRVMSRFDVALTVSRSGEPDRTERGVLHLDIADRSPEGSSPVVSPLSQVDVADSVDLAEGDEVTCSDTREVAVETTWVITELAQADVAGGIDRWWMRQTSPAPERLYNATIIVRPESSRDNNGDPVLGSQVSVDCWIVEGAEHIDAGEVDRADRTRLVTQEREFLITDRIWMPDDTVNTTPPLGRRPARVGEAWTDGQTVYWCEL